MTVRISGELKSATGINISTGPPERDDLKDVIEGPPGPEGQTNVIELTRTEFDALVPKDPDTIYFITDETIPAGPPGPTYITARWSYSTQTSTPPATGQMRTTDDTVYLSKRGIDGFNREQGIQQLAVGDPIQIKTDKGDIVIVNVTTLPVDHDTWWEFTYAAVSGDANAQKNQDVELQFAVPPSGRSIPPGGTVGQVLKKTGPGDFEVGWMDP